MGLLRTIYSKYDNGKEDRRFRFECCRVVADTYSYPSVSTSKDANFVGDWDSTWDNRGSSRFLCGQESYHDNYREDRRFKFKKCLASGASIGTRYNLEVTEWDGQWQKSCGCYNNGNSAMTGAWSQHNNYKEDRLFTFEFGELNPGYKLVSCGWTGYVNNWDGELNFECTNNGLIRSIWSRHDNYREDRLWRFECCQTAYTMSSGQSISSNPSNPSNPLNPSNDKGYGMEASTYNGYKTKDLDSKDYKEYRYDPYARYYKTDSGLDSKDSEYEMRSILNGYKNEDYKKNDEKEYFNDPYKREYFNNDPYKREYFNNDPYKREYRADPYAREYRF